LQQRISVIQQLEKNKTGGQELLQMVANTVNRTETLWLTTLSRQGNSLTIEGRAGSINAVANFISQLKRSGYFDKVEIKETHQDEQNKEVTNFLFTLTAEVGQPASGQPAATPPAPARKG
jgi:Tfp pilus assembly protein PilN